MTPNGISDCVWANALFKVRNNDYDSISGYQWRYLLKNNPLYENICVWEALSGDDWVDVLMWHPLFKDKCNWTLITKQNWDYLYKHQRRLRHWMDTDGIPYLMMLEIDSNN